jgi:hypothetical protein
MLRKLIRTTQRQRIWLILILMSPALVYALSPAQGDLGRAKQMIQQLENERLEAAKAGATSKFTATYIDERLAAIGASVNQGLLSELNAPSRPSCEALEGELRAALGYGSVEDPHVASVTCMPSKGRVYYVVAYALTFGVAYSRSWIGIFAPSVGDGQYQTAASAADSLPSKTVALKPLPIVVGGKLSFLAYGINWSDAHNRLSVIAYSLSKGRLEPIWSRADLPEGDIKLEGTKIKLTLLSSPLGPGYESVHEISEVYEVSGSGIRLEKRLESPRP